ncbi:IPExxxVDY family protein [Tenacibaculum sp. IB213877]|uniref:IPExxxVDY family protein n=1 Tax=Tenacibaculum sp. IB213877 TaxID=3097351 RepID=UPI002A59EDDB|nr:IPExxxVDY family protein [Tenacibaculum sp. IB213877]MDY0781221.1 IPExxxVDY family protein [Tenacibaculum sp. IB213877]
MPIYSLEINEFYNNDYALIGVHTTLEDYRLAFLLNKTIGVKFKRANYDLDFKSKKHNSFYSVYDYTNKKLGLDWFLISNVYKTQLENINFELFNESETIIYLIPEKKRVDFFLKIEGDFDYDFIVKTTEKINQIPQVITSYSIDSNTLKSKEFLIF